MCFRGDREEGGFLGGGCHGDSNTPVPLPTCLRVPNLLVEGGGAREQQEGEGEGVAMFEREGEEGGIKPEQTREGLRRTPSG